MSDERLQVGDKAPSFSLSDGEGKVWDLEDLRGKKVVLYFYPVDQTRGCTAQACDFRDSIDRFLGSNYQVLGVSPQDAASHQEFAAAHDLNFPLLVDEGGQVAQRYGVWQDIGRDGRSVMGNKRSTFVIDENGTLEYVEYGVQWDGSVQRLMDTLGV